MVIHLSLLPNKSLRNFTCSDVLELLQSAFPVKHSTETDGGE